jgi:hypothetical protein
MPVPWPFEGEASLNRACINLRKQALHIAYRPDDRSHDRQGLRHRDRVPTLNIKRTLPLSEPVVIEFTPAETGDIAFA